MLRPERDIYSSKSYSRMSHGEAATCRGRWIYRATQPASWKQPSLSGSTAEERAALGLFLYPKKYERLDFRVGFLCTMVGYYTALNLTSVVMFKYFGVSHIRHFTTERAGEEATCANNILQSLTVNQLL